MNSTEKNKKVFPMIWIIVLFLFILVLLTAILVGTYFKGLSSRDKNVINLVPDQQIAEEIGDGTEDGGQNPEGSAGDSEAVTDKAGTDNADNAENNGGAYSGQQMIVARPGFEGQDGKGAWKTQTQVNIFNDYYYNDDYVWTVRSKDGDKVIAPGTGNVYTFQLKNTGNISMDYTLTVESIFDMGEIKLPIEVRLKSGDGTYIVGDEENWVYPADMNKVVETGTLDVNRYATYSLEWQWPFTKEYATPDWDVNDTYAGNAAVYKDLNFTVIINTLAEATPGAKPVAGSWLNGIFNPKTGDDTNIMPYIVGMALAVVVLFLLIIVRKRKRSDEKENQNENQP